LKRFLIGYSPDVWDAFSQAAIDAGYDKKWLLASGLSRERDSGGLWDFFKGRVMFPIRDITGRVIGFGGRTLKKDKDQAKYYNSPESALYHKSDVLFGIHLAKPAITKRDEVLLVEGYTDVMALHQAGLEHAVASSGTALTEGQIKIIRRFTKRVVVLFDGDAAGVRASLRGIDLLLAAGLQVKVLSFPEGDDPDSYSRKVSSAELQRFVSEEAQDFVGFKIQTLLADAGTDPLRRAEAVRSVVESIAAIPDAIERSVYLQSSAHQLGVSEELLQGEVNKAVLRLLEAKRKSEERKKKRTSDTARTPQGRMGAMRAPMPEPPSYHEAPPPIEAPPIPDEPQPGWVVGPDGTIPEWTGPERPPLPSVEAGGYGEEDPVRPPQGQGSLLDVPRRYFLEKDLVRLLVNYGGVSVEVPIESESEDEEAANTERHPFAEWVIHSLEEERIDFEYKGFKRVIEYTVSCLDEQALPNFSDLLLDQDQEVQQVLADAMLVQHAVSENWALRHQIYPELEKDHLEKALMDAMHHLRLDNIQKRIRELSSELESAERADASNEVIRELLLERIKLDREKSELAKYFGSTILAN
jgi:DNA primase